VLTTTTQLRSFITGMVNTTMNTYNHFNKKVNSRIG